MSMSPTAPTLPVHTHHWLIEEPNRPLSQGLCRSCGATRVFRNSIEEIEITTNKDWATAA
jgi:hypothetical protein